MFVIRQKRQSKSRLIGDFMRCWNNYNWNFKSCPSCLVKDSLKASCIDLPKLAFCILISRSNIDESLLGNLQKISQFIECNPEINLGLLLKHKKILFIVWQFVSVITICQIQILAKLSSKDLSSQYIFSESLDSLKKSLKSKRRKING